MKIGFINTDEAHDYNTDTPFEHSLAGSESAQVYLAIELAKRGHEIHLINGTTRPGLRRGVHCRFLDEAIGSKLEFDAVWVTNSPYSAIVLRSMLNPDVPIVTWEQNLWNPDANNVESLKKHIANGDHVACVSEWHRTHFINAGKLQPEKILVLKNAISPVFERIFKDQSNILDSKAWPPVLAFTATPHKGLETALNIFPRLQNVYPEISLNVFSDFSSYSPGSTIRSEPQWQALYNRCLQMEGVNYVGTVSQTKLAQALISINILFYPNIFLETSGITVMEALAAGCCVIAPDFGALSETLAGFGTLVPTRNSMFSQQLFAEANHKVLQLCANKDENLKDHLIQQVAFVNKHYTWALRAKEAEAIIQRIINERKQNV